MYIWNNAYIIEYCIASRTKTSSLAGTKSEVAIMIGKLQGSVTHAKKPAEYKSQLEETETPWSSRFQFSPEGQGQMVSDVIRFSWFIKQVYWISIQILNSILNIV